MPAVLRKALFWLLMLALPMQTSMAVGAMRISPVSGPQAGMHVMHISEAGATGMADDQAPAQPDCAGLPDCAAMHRAGGNCALAAPCALVPVPMGPIAMILPKILGCIPASVAVQRRVFFFTDGPERPPRSSLI